MHCGHVRPVLFGRMHTTIVESGPYRFTRNPICVSMFLGLIGLAIAFDNLWLLTMLAPFALVVRYSVVVARNRVSKFGGTAPAVALEFKSLGHEQWFYYYLAGIIFLWLLIYTTMRDTKHDSAMQRHV